MGRHLRQRAVQKVAWRKLSIVELASKRDAKDKKHSRYIIRTINYIPTAKGNKIPTVVHIRTPHPIYQTSTPRENQVNAIH